MVRKRQQNLEDSGACTELLQQNISGQDSVPVRKSQWLPVFHLLTPQGVFLLLLFFLAGSAGPVFAINFNAYWAYRQSGGEARETLAQFQQRYTLGIGQALTYQPTHALRASAAIGYTRSQSDSGNGFVSTNNLNPSAQISLTNDIFQAQLSGATDIRSSEGRDTSRTSWNASLLSTWNIPLWPRLRFTYSENTEPADNFTFFNTSGQKETNTGIGLTWDLVLAQLSYQYNRNSVSDPLGSSLAENSSHFARLQTDGQFWDKRLSYTFAQQFGYSTQDVTIEAEDGFFVSPLEGETFGKVTIPGTPDDITPDEDDYEVPDQRLPLAVEVGERAQLYFAGEFPEQIDILRLGLADSFTVTQALELTWELYARNDRFEQWELALDNLQATATVNDDESIDVEVGLEAAEVILVAKNVPSTPLTFTSLQAFTLLTENFASTITNSLTNFSLGYRITRNLRAAGYLTYEQNHTSNDDLSFGSSRRSVSGNLRWTPRPFISPALSFSEYRTDTDLGSDDISRTYGLTVTTIPMESLNVSFGVTHSDRYTDALKDFASDRYSINLRAQVYPDLTGTWNLSYSDSEELKFDGIVDTTKRISSSLRLYAQLTRNLGADLLTGYSHTKTDIDTTQNANAIMSLRYRPSDILSLRGGYATYFLDNISPDRLDLNMTLQLMNTQKTRLTVTATHSQLGDSTIDNFGLVGSWDISRYFTLVTQANYRFAEVDAYNFRINLSLSL